MKTQDIIGDRHRLDRKIGRSGSGRLRLGHDGRRDRRIANMFLCAGLFALSFCCACLRFGYDAKRVTTEPKPDASTPEAGTKPDASVPDAAAMMAMDAAMPMRDATTDADTQGTGMPGAASMMDGAAEPNAGTPPTASVDSGAVDAAANPEVVDLCPERADAIFCDSFEDAIGSAAFDAKWQFKVDTGGTFLRSTSPVHSGTGALKAMTTHDPKLNSYARYGSRVSRTSKRATSGREPGITFRAPSTSPAISRRC